MSLEFDQFEVLRKIKEDDKITQRKLANKLGFSLGKLNYCLKALRNKGYIKITNFKKNPNKIKYLYLITPKGVSQKAKLTIMFMRRKMREYDELKKELKDLKNKN
tara:strand:+ start:397 stop:711 length:315 start_codon:yes stop_codon:yes gene_type:complete